MQLLKVIFLFPIALIYRLITGVRNLLYRFGILDAQLYSVPVVVVGNLSVGGTGKTPHVEYLVKKLLRRFNTATLSRGYGRETSGFLEVSPAHTYKDTGDEPLQLKHKFPKLMVAVDENRGRGIRILKEAHTPEVILLDDAFQHRRVMGGLSILLTPYHNLFTDDFILPLGRLRESKKGAGRANIIIVTKTPKIFSPLEKRSIETKLNIKKHQEIYFTRIDYGELRPVFKNNLPVPEQLEEASFLLVTGIADTQPLTEYLNSKYCRYEHLKFPDHHAFSEKDTKRISEKFNNIIKKEKFILSTEKDAVRLKEMEHELSDLPFYMLPIEIQFQEKEDEFIAKVLNYVRENK